MSNGAVSGAIRPESADNTGESSSKPIKTRRRFLQTASAVGLVSLAGCTISIDEHGIRWGDGEEDASDPDTTEGIESQDPSPEPTAKRYEVDNFELTSHNGDVDVYGKISMRGIYDETEYINPRGRTSWEVLNIDEHNYFAVEEGTPQDIIVNDTIIEFPPEAVEDLDESEPLIIVRVDLGERRESEDNIFIGWESHRVFLDELDGDGEDVTMQFTGGGNDVRLSYTVKPIDD